MKYSFNVSSLSPFMIIYFPVPFGKSLTDAVAVFLLPTANVYLEADFPAIGFVVAIPS